MVKKILISRDKKIVYFHYFILSLNLKVINTIASPGKAASVISTKVEFFFVYGYGGNGKTFLCKTLSYKFRLEKNSVKCSFKLYYISFSSW